MDSALSSSRLPPAFRRIPLREHADAFAEACRRAETEGAGAFFEVRRFDLIEIAVVLEPDEPLARARRAVFAGMAALADAVSSFAPPGKPVTLAYPATLLFDGARLGGGRLGWPDGCGEDEVPGWLVFGAMLLASPVGIADRGAYPAVTWLEEEGFAADERDLIPGSFARHLLRGFDLWADRGFEAVAEDFLARLEGLGEGLRRIDDTGDLQVERPDGAQCTVLLPGLRQPDWLDPAARAPRLSP